MNSNCSEISYGAILTVLGMGPPTIFERVDVQVYLRSTLRGHAALNLGRRGGLESPPVRFWLNRDCASVLNGRRTIGHHDPTQLNADGGTAFDVDPQPGRDKPPLLSLVD